MTDASVPALNTSAPPEEFYHGKRALITGGLGFIGSNLAHRLVGLGARLLIVDSLVPGCGGNFFNLDGIEDQVDVNICDAGDAHSMNFLVRGQDFIFNLAGNVSHLDSMERPFDDLNVNVRAQLSVLEACRRHNPTARIVYAGTRQPYGIPSYLPVDENHLLRPTDVNGVHKMAGEWYHMVYRTAYGLWTTSLRLTNTYGPRQLISHNRQGFIGWFVHQVVTSDEITIFGDGAQRRDPLFVEDAVSAFLIAGACDEAAGQVFNVAGRDVISLRDFAALLVEVAGQGSYETVPWPPERKAIDIGDFYASNGKANRVLGWHPQTGIRQGLEQTVAFYMKHKEHYL
jgi:UDP-glucose 4-epimerase